MGDVTDPLVTATHARLRAGQGDREGALRILGELLRRRPRDGEARALLRSLHGAGRPGVAGALGRWLAALGARVKRGQGMLDDELAALQAVLPGVRAVVLVGLDGMIAAACPRDGGERVEWIAASYADLVRRSDAANREAGLEVSHELVAAAGDATVLFRRVTPDYGLLMLLDPQGSPLGRARYELAKTAARVLPEVSA